jgi:hypothetical protein
MRDDPGRHANRSCPRRHVTEHNRVRADDRIVSDRDAAEHLRASEHDHAVPKRRIRIGAATTPQRHLLVEMAVTSDDRAAGHHEPMSMHDDQPRPKRGSGLYLDSGEHAIDCRDDDREGAMSPAMQAVCQPIQAYGVPVDRDEAAPGRSLTSRPTLCGENGRPGLG